MNFLDANDSDPNLMGWMQGSPPPADKLVRWADMGMYTFPKLRWAMSNYIQLRPTKRIDRGCAPVTPLPLSLRHELDEVMSIPMGSAQAHSWAQSLLANYTDAIVVLHRGRRVYERYMGAMDERRSHMCMSVTKSFVGTLAAMLADEGAFDIHRPVTDYVPEFAQSAYGTATVDQVMDMRIGVRYSENYADPNADIWNHARAGGVFPPRPGDAAPIGFRAYLCGLQAEGEHGQGFTYKTVNTDVLGWVLHRVTGHDVARLIQDCFWQVLGMEHDAHLGVDDMGTDFAGGGLNCTVRDLARFGEMLRCGGEWQGQRVMSESTVASIAKGGSPAAFSTAGYQTLPGWSYRRMWWVSHNDHGAYMARGIHGQSLYIDPKAEMVIARFGSHPMASNVHNDAVTLPAFAAMAQALMG